MSEFEHLRKHARISDTLMVRLELLDGPGGNTTDSTVASTLDYSAGGMLLRTTREMPIGTFLKLRFKLKAGSPEILAEGHTLRYELPLPSELFYAAVIFDRIRPEDSQAIDAFVHEKLKIWGLEG